MSESMTVQLTPQMLTVIPILALAIQMLKKQAPIVFEKIPPILVAVVASIGMAILMKMGTGLQDQVVSGIIMGLATAGGYDAAKGTGKAEAQVTTRQAELKQWPLP